MDPNRFKDPHYLVTNKTVNREAKKMLLRPENIDSFAKAVTHYAFRNGPVEDMHTEKKLSQDDMRTLNKYMVNRLAGPLFPHAGRPMGQTYGCV